MRAVYGVFTSLVLLPCARAQSVEPHVQTLWNAAQDGATISPDGKLIAFIDWNSGDIAVRDVTTATERRLTNTGMFARSRGFPEPNIVFSPASDRLIYTFGNNETGAPFSYELRMVGIDSIEQEVLVRYPPEVEFVAPLDWHADAGLLLTIVAADASSELLLMRLEDRSVRVLERRAAGSGVVYRAVFAPDARTIVYLANGKLHQLAASGGTSQQLGVDAEALLGWSSDGRSLLFHSTRGNIIGNWAAAMRDGRVHGEPTLQLRTSAGVNAAGQTIGGTAYLESAARPALFVVTLDIAGAQVVDSARAIPPFSDSIPGNPSWSPDGGRLAFTVRAPGRNLHRIMISEGLRGPAREVARVNLRVMGLDWSADSRFLVIGGRSDTRPLAWVGRIDVATGAVDRLVSGPVNAVAAAGGEAVAYVRAASAGERTVRVVVIPGRGAVPRVLATYPLSELPRSMSVSPDGRWVALVKSVDDRRASALLLLPVEGGESRTILRLERPDALELNAGTIPWTPDGSKVLVLMRRQGRRQLAAVDVGSGATTLPGFATRQSGRSHPALHPDGRQLVYVDGAERTELKLLTGADRQPR